MGPQWTTSLPRASSAPLQEGQHHPVLHQQECCQQVEGGDPSSLLSPGEATSEALCSVLCSQEQKRYGLIDASPEKGCKDD